MSQITRANRYQEFKQECHYFRCRGMDVYGKDWTGTEKYIVTSDTPESALKEKYPEIMGLLSPYIFCCAALGDIFLEEARSSERYLKRTQVTILISTEQDLTGLMQQASETTIEIIEQRILIESALRVCSPLERKRITQYFFEGKTLSEISGGHSATAVRSSIRSGLARMKKYLALL